MNPPLIKLNSFSNNSFDREASSMKEAVWILCKVLFFLLPIPLPSKLRVSILQLFGATIGKDTVIREGVNIKFPWKLKLGDHVWLGERVVILNLDKVIIGDHVCISQETFLCTGSHDFDQGTFDLIVKEIEIKNHCWLGARSFIAPGVTIGEASFINACSLVRKNIPKGSRVSGNPATISKS